jgi:hypothetical protein
MPRSERQQRRRLLLALALLPLWRLGLARAGGSRGAAPAAASLWSCRCREYLQTQTSAAEREMARTLVAPHLPAVSGSPLPAALRARAQADWHAGRIVAVDGWLIAHTELYWHALAGDERERAG